MCTLFLKFEVHTSWEFNAAYCPTNTPMKGPVCFQSESSVCLLSAAVCWPCRGTDFDDAGDVLVDADCQHTADLGKMFGSKRQIRLHTGFWRAWESVAPTVIPLIEEQLAKVSQAAPCNDPSITQPSVATEPSLMLRSAGDPAEYYDI